MRLLLITSEEWNDAVYGNNVLTNWFEGFDAEFAQIYCSPGLPYNKICDRYFQVTDVQMVRSLYTFRKAGAVVNKPTSDDDIKRSRVNAQRRGSYKWLKMISSYIHEPMMIIRDAIWLLGRYDKGALKQFVDTFNPDIVFCPRMFSPKLGRLERLVSGMTKAPFVAFTADNEASLNCYSWSPLFWLRRLYIHHIFAKHVNLYKHYLMFSVEQAQEYNKEYRIPTSCLYKCGDFPEFKSKTVNKPIRMIYAGRLYCNRWKTLAAIGQALMEINRKSPQMVLDIYTADNLTSRQKKTLQRFDHIRVHNSIPSEQLIQEYQKADIALHVESFDKANRLATHYSFSTKIIDLMASSCAILAICWEHHAGYQYLHQHDAAFCVSSYEGILPMLERICDNPGLIGEYAEKARMCGIENHTRERIQGQISRVFCAILTEQ